MQAEDVLAAIRDQTLEIRWTRVEDRLEARFGQRPELEAMLFLIGIQSRGVGYEPNLEKETKQDVIMEGTYRAFAELGIYEHWPEGWQPGAVRMPTLTIPEQENLLRLAVVTWFERHFPERQGE